MTLISLLLILTFPTEIPDGSLLFIEGGNQMVMDYTESPYSHVALIFNQDGKPFVYEAIRPVCRKISLEDYIKQVDDENRKKLKNMKIWIKTPKLLSDENANNMKNYCEQQLGRKYRIKNFFSEQPSQFIHCSELTTNALLAGNMNLEGNPCCQSPKDVMNKSTLWYNNKVEIQ